MIVSVSPLTPIAAFAFAALFLLAAWTTARAPSYALALLFFVQPFAWAHTLGRTTITCEKITLLGVLIGLSVYPLITRRLREPGIRALLIGSLAIVVVELLASSQTMHRGAAFHEIGKWFEYLLLLICAYLASRLDPEQTPLRIAVVTATLPVCASALAQLLLGAPSAFQLPNGATIPRIAGLLAGPNQLAMFLEVAIALLAVWSLRERAWGMRVLLAVTLLTQVATFSRAGMLAAVIVLGVVAWRSGKQGRMLAIPILAAAAGTLAMLAGWMHAAHLGNVDTLLRRPGAAISAGGVGNRRELWSAAWRLWLRRPWLGSGPGSFQPALPSLGLPTVRTHANSLPLQTLAEGGVLLFATMLAFFGAILRRFWRANLATPMALAALAATLGLGLHSLLDNPFYTPQVVAWWFLLVGAAAAQPDSGA